MEKIQFNERPLLIDRVQVSISPKFLLDDDLISYFGSYFGSYLSFKKEYNILYIKKREQYYIDVPSDVINSWSFFNHAQIRMNNPYTVTAEFNFIRMLRDFIFTTERKNFNFDYDKKILVNEDNYINLESWSKWNRQAVSNLEKVVSGTCMSFADDVIKQYIMDFDVPFNFVSIKHIEFNKDYFVGRNNSSNVLHEIMQFLFSGSGVEWLSSLNSYALNFYGAEDKKVMPNAYGDFYNPTLKFYIAKGIFFKIYRKTTDHIRLELTFEGNYIKRKFKTQNFDKVFLKLKRFAKAFFKKTMFKDVLDQVLTKTYNDGFAYISKIYDVLDRYQPELSNILDSVIHENPVSDKDSINFIKKNRDFSKFFVSSYLGNGKRVYRYNPMEAVKQRGVKRVKRLKPPVKSVNPAIEKKPLFICSECENTYTGDFCPNCSRKHWLNKDEDKSKGINWWSDSSSKNRDYPYF